MSKEYIDKEKVLSELCSDCKGIAYCRVPCALYDYINDSPPADAKPVVRGEWKTLNKIVYCSECETCHPYRTNFCSNCGADMRKEANNDA